MDESRHLIRSLEGSTHQEVVSRTLLRGMLLRENGTHPRTELEIDEWLQELFGVRSEEMLDDILDTAFQLWSEK